VQVDPIKPTLKAPGTKRLRLKYDVPLSNLLSNLTCAATARSSTPLWKRSSLRRPPCNTARLVGPCNCEIRSCEYLHIVLHASDPCFLRYISSDDVAIITHLALIHLALRPGDSAAAAAAAAAVAAAAAGGGAGVSARYAPGEAHAVRLDASTVHSLHLLRGGGGGAEATGSLLSFLDATVTCPGRAVQVDPFKHTLKAPATERSKLNSDEPLSIFAMKFNLRRYTPAAAASASGCCSPFVTYPTSLRATTRWTNCCRGAGSWRRCEARWPRRRWTRSAGWRGPWRWRRRARTPRRRPWSAARTPRRTSPPSCQTSVARALPPRTPERTLTPGRNTWITLARHPPTGHAV